MLTFPFYCPSCEQVADAKADPVGLLFGKRGGFTVECSNCETKFNADIQFGAVGQTLKLGAPFPPEDKEDAE